MRFIGVLKRTIVTVLTVALVITMMPITLVSSAGTDVNFEDLSVREIYDNGHGGILIDTEGNAYAWGGNAAAPLYDRRTLFGSVIFSSTGDDASPVKAYREGQYASELKQLRYFDHDVKMIQFHASSNVVALHNDGTVSIWAHNDPIFPAMGDNDETMEEMKKPWVLQNPSSLEGYGRIKYINLDCNTLFFVNEENELYKKEYVHYRDETPVKLKDGVKKYISIDISYDNDENAYTLCTDGHLECAGKTIFTGVKDFQLSTTNKYSQQFVFVTTEADELYCIKLSTEKPHAIESATKVCDGVKALYSDDNNSQRCYLLKNDGFLYYAYEDKIEKVAIAEKCAFADSAQNNDYVITQSGNIYFKGFPKYEEVPFDMAVFGNDDVYQVTNWTKVKGAAPVKLLETTDPAQDLTLSLTYLDSVKDASTAGTAVKNATSSMTSEQKESPLGVDKATVYAEEAVARAATTEVTGDDIVIDQALVSDLNTKSSEAVNTVENSLSNVGINLDREINEAVIVNTAGEGKRTVKFAGDIDANDVDSIIVQQGDLRVVVPTDVIAEEGGFAVTIGEDSSTGTIVTCDENSASVTLEPFAASMGQSFKVTFDKSKLKSNVKISIPATGGDTKYQAIVDKNGKAIGGKYNPITGKLEAKISEGGTFTVKTNEIDFSDITGKSAAMKAAIKELAAKGIIGGTSATTFSPDKSISRAELAAIILRTLGKVDASADGKFTDVPKSKWYFATAGSSKKYGLVTGYPDGTFKGDVAISKVQTIAVSARTLRSEMNYKTPASVATYIGKYTDGSSIASWAAGDVALATRENLVVRRSDGKFAPDENITRGEAALILKTLFDRVW